VVENVDIAYGSFVIQRDLTSPSAAGSTT